MKEREYVKLDKVRYYNKRIKDKQTNKTKCWLKIEGSIAINNGKFNTIDDSRNKKKGEILSQQRKKKKRERR